MVGLQQLLITGYEAKCLTILWFVDPDCADYVKTTYQTSRYRFMMIGRSE